MYKRIQPLLCLTAIVAASLLSGCGDDNTGDTRATSGTVTDEYAAFCTATFTEDYAVRSDFDDPLFTAREGEQYLMARYTTFRGDVEADLLYLTSAGPLGFRIEAEEGRALPFTSNCEPGQTVPHAAVFTDVVLYTDEALTQEACRLEAGTTVQTRGLGFSAVSDDFDFNAQSAVYDVQMFALSDVCDGHSVTYVSVPFTDLFDTSRTLFPIGVVIGAE